MIVRPIARTATATDTATKRLSQDIADVSSDGEFVGPDGDNPGRDPVPRAPFTCNGYYRLRTGRPVPLLTHFVISRAK